MASRYIINEAANDPSKLLKPQDPHQELVQSLTRLVEGYPPKESYTPDECGGLYSGPTSIAYLFLHLHHSKLETPIAGRQALEWAKSYLSGQRPTSTPQPTMQKNGVSSEKLAHLAVHAAVTQDVKLVKQLVQEVHNVALSNERGGSDEWLYGRAGCLYLLRLAKYWVLDGAKVVEGVVEEVIGRILEGGPRWPWGKKDYIGAAHGRIGILTQILLTDPSKVSKPVLVQSLYEVLKVQSKDGNFPSAMESRHNHFVQFCHGAPGVIISLRAIQGLFTTGMRQKIAHACELAEKCVVKKGILVKEPSLCHGVVGNALALTGVQRNHLMAYATGDSIDELKKEGGFVGGNDAYGLFCGEAGRAWGWLVLVSGGKKGVIGYSDV